MELSRRIFKDSIAFPLRYWLAPGRFRNHAHRPRILLESFSSFAGQAADRQGILALEGFLIWEGGIGRRKWRECPRNMLILPVAPSSAIAVSLNFDVLPIKSCRSVLSQSVRQPQRIVPG